MASKALMDVMRSSLNTSKVAHGAMASRVASLMLKPKAEAQN